MEYPFEWVSRTELAVTWIEVDREPLAVSDSNLEEMFANSPEILTVLREDSHDLWVSEVILCPRTNNQNGWQTNTTQEPGLIEPAYIVRKQVQLMAQKH